MSLEYIFLYVSQWKIISKSELLKLNVCYVANISIPKSINTSFNLITYSIYEYESSAKTIFNKGLISSSLKQFACSNTDKYVEKLINALLKD